MVGEDVKIDAVSNKIKKLSIGHSDIPIYRGAKKYVIVDDWDGVPEKVDKAWFGRSLFLQRKKYWEVLSTIMDREGVSAQQVAVVGDIYELDLILPEYKGMHIILTPRQGTPDFELRAVTSYQKGHVARDLNEVLTVLD